MIKIILSNLRRHKSSMITLFILLTLASLLLTVGLSISFGLGPFFTNKVEELNTPHISLYINTPQIDAFNDRAQAFDGIEAYEAMPTIFAEGGKFTAMGKKDSSMSLYIQNIDTAHEMSIANIINEGDSRPENAIVLPLIFRDSYGYKTGDSINMNLGENSTFAYEIYGFAEDAYYSSPMMGIFRILLCDTAYNALAASRPEGSMGTAVSVRMQDADKTGEMFRHLSSVADTVEIRGKTMGFTIETVEMAAVTALGIMSMMVIGFSFIMVIVALIVVSFSITTAVEDGIQSIGILKGIGYKNSQVVLSLILQYGIIGGIAALLSMVGFVFFIPIIGQIGASSSGLTWDLKPSPLAMLLDFIVIIGLVVLIAAMAARRTKKITPLIALRNGIETHNFKRNAFPLEKARANVNITIAARSVFGNIKQNSIILIIITALTFAAIFSLQMYANMVLDTRAMKYMMGIPLSDVWVVSGDSDEKRLPMFEEIIADEDIEKATSYEQQIIKFEDIDMVGLYTSDKFEEIDIKVLIDGRYPQHDNEIAITSMIAEKIGKKIGDVMPFTLYGKTEELLIVGIAEQMSQMGFCIYITESGMQQFSPDYTVGGYILDLKEGVDIKEFISRTSAKYSDVQKGISDIPQMFAEMLGSMEMGVSAVVIVILVIMVLAILLILYLIIKVKLLRERTNIGLLKSLGFTSGQLILQTALGFTGVIFVGTVAGGILGCVFSNPVMALVLGVMGVNSASFTINYGYIALLAAGVTALAFLISSLVASRLKKITPYNLLVE